MKRHNLAFIDTETTGLNPDKHELIEIGCVIVSQDWTDNKAPVFTHVEEFELKIKPAHIETADKQALRINGYNEADWIFAYDLKDAMDILRKKTKDCIMVSHNLSFDTGFVDKAFRVTGVKNEMYYPRIDTISLAFAKLHNKDNMRYSLGALAEYYGVKNTNAHTALADTIALFEVYKKLMMGAKGK